jgi:hypothetical protein
MVISTSEVDHYMFIIHIWCSRNSVVSLFVLSLKDQDVVVVLADGVAHVFQHIPNIIMFWLDFFEPSDQTVHQTSQLRFGAVKNKL